MSLEGICTKGAGPLEITNQWDRRFIADVAGHAMSGSPISTAQGTVILKLIDRYREHLVLDGANPVEVDTLLRSPHYKVAPYQSTNLPREVRWMGDNKLVFRFKFNAPIMEDIKRLKGSNHFLNTQYPLFVRDHKLWIVDLNSENLESVMNLIKRHRFMPDDTTIQYFLEASNAQGKKPVVEVKDETLEIKVRDDDFVNAWTNLIKQLEG